MINSKVKYISTLDEIIAGSYDKETDYVLKAEYPLNSSIFEKLLDIEMNQADVLETTFIEFESIDLNGRQILNLANNMNMNILLKTVTDTQMEEMLTGYANMDMKRLVYPTKIIVLIVLYALYLQIFHGVDVFENWENLVNVVTDKFINYTYISDKYSNEFIVYWSKWFMMYLLDQKQDFVKDFAQHCEYLFSVSYEYHKNPNKVYHVVNPGPGLKSGLYVPLAFVIRDMKFNPFKIYVEQKGFDYTTGIFKGMVIRAISPLVDFTLACEQYITHPDKEVFEKENLNDLTDEEILGIIRDKKKVVTKNATTEKDLFPIEVVVE